MFSIAIVFRIILQAIYYVLLFYYLFIVLYFVMSWIPPLYGTKIFNAFNKITRPFMNLVSGKLIIGRFDLGSTIGLLVYYFLIQIIWNISISI